MKLKTWSTVALALSSVVFLVVVLTSLIDGATYLSRLHTTIIAWNIPLVTIGVIIYSFVSEKEEGKFNLFAWIAVGLMAFSMLCSNITKNYVQDAGSNVKNYVDVAAKIIKKESRKAEMYEKTLENAAKSGMKKNRSYYDDEDYDW